ncbi:hypothetical protein C9374_002450 [Naegleria lovaniensis]|uniref:Protein kinase domain-containing protein n=1 Tax=Naegleria lovaniensis TaxID=51637 RepID=A0AA88GVN9_NAELO|nr:uncharacterized protein C9374_002450 [Naegleria lovaniensis]KAG2386706.1 hypothetical protein C9374_002450 [Naegleria lovaniensis]
MYSSILLYSYELNGLEDSNNNALSYGNFISYPLRNFTFHSTLQFSSSRRITIEGVSTIPDIAMYPGEKLQNLSLIIQHFDGEFVKFLVAPLSIKYSSTFIKMDYLLTTTTSSSSNYNLQINNLSVRLLSPTTSQNVSITAFLVIDASYEIPFNIITLPCPERYHLESRYSVDGFICVEDSHVPFEIIIPVVRVVQKLKTLEKKQRAEKKLESNFIGMKTYIEGGYSLLQHDFLDRSSENSTYLIPVEDLSIIKKIGEGGNGSVYHAKWNGSEVAVKSIKSDVSNEESEEFQKEAALLSTLRHPNIVNFYGVSIINSTKCMVVEYLSRGSLDRMIYNCRSRQCVLKLFQKLDILLGVAKGMAYMHSLKPNPVVDVYSFAIIMWELFFEETPYMSQHSKKFQKFKSHSTTSTDSNEGGARALMQVLKGNRSLIPFSIDNNEELVLWLNEFLVPQNPEIDIQTLVKIVSTYIDLMKQCWQSNPELRPNFLQIVEVLSSLLM